MPDGTNEITQVKALAKELGIQDGETVLATLDAAHCNKETAEFIGGKPGWDYLITVKTDKPTLYRKAAGKIRPLLDRDPDDVMTDRSHGVIKTWSCWITDAGEIEFPHISQVACICREVRSQSWAGNGPRALASLRNFATGLFRMKNVKSIKEATEMVHMDRMLVLHYMATTSNERCAALPANGPGLHLPLDPPAK